MACVIDVESVSPEPVIEDGLWNILRTIEMAAASVLYSIGWVFCVAGLLTEFLSVIAMNVYEIRRRLPFKSPFQLMGLGCYCFFIGVVFLVIGSFLS